MPGGGKVLGPPDYTPPHCACPATVTCCADTGWPCHYGWYHGHCTLYWFHPGRQPFQCFGSSDESHWHFFTTILCNDCVERGECATVRGGSCQSHPQLRTLDNVYKGCLTTANLQSPLRLTMAHVHLFSIRSITRRPPPQTAPRQASSTSCIEKGAGGAQSCAIDE